MTFKKINKMGQSIVEYFILTIAVLAVIFFFANTQVFRDTQDSCNAATNQAILTISGVQEGNTITP